MFSSIRTVDLHLTRQSLYPNLHPFQNFSIKNTKKTTINFVSSNLHLKNLIFSLQLIKQKFVQFDFVNSCIGTVMSDQKNLIKMVPCLKDSDPDLTET